MSFLFPPERRGPDLFQTLETLLILSLLFSCPRQGALPHWIQIFVIFLIFQTLVTYRPDHVVVVTVDVMILRSIDKILPRQAQAGLKSVFYWKTGSCVFITKQEKEEGVADLINVNDPPAGVFAVRHNAEVYQVVSGVAMAETYFDITWNSHFHL